MKGLRVLVTGGSGFIGSAVVRRLVSEGARVRVLDDDSRGSPRRLEGIMDHIEFVRGDVRVPATVLDAARGIDVLMHLAFVNGTEFFYSKPDLVLDVGVKGMVNVIDACRVHGIRRFVLASSSEVYQTPPVIPTPEGVPLIVPDPLNPRYSYGGGKIISELMAINYGRTLFDALHIFRPHNVYGPDMGFEHVIPQFALRMRELARKSEGPLQFPVQGSGQETRAFVHIDDFVDGLLVMLGRGAPGIYHIGNDEEVSIAELARLVGACFGRAVELIPGELQSGSTLRRCPDIGKLRALGYTPKRPLATAIKGTVLWYDEHAHLAPPR